MMTLTIYVMTLAIITGAVVIAVLLGDRILTQHEIKQLKQELQKEKSFNTTTQGAIKTYAETAKNAVDALHAHVFPKKEGK